MLGSGPSKWDANEQQIGRYLLQVVEDPSWVRRRVESVRLTGLGAIERRISLDLDIERLIDIAEEAGLRMPARLPVPIAILEKGLLPEIDVTGPAGESLSVATSSQDSRAAQLAMLAHISSFTPAAVTASTAIQQKLFDIAADHPSRADADLIRLGGGSGFVSAWRLDESLHASSDEVREWSALFESREFVSLLAQFTVNFLLVVEIDDTRPTTIVKVRYIESIPAPERSYVPKFLPTDLTDYKVEANAVGRAQREHIRFLLPEGIQLVSSLLYVDSERSADSSPLSPEDLGQRYMHRETLDRAMFYTRGASPNAHKLFVTVRPTADGFLSAAILGTVFTLLISLGGFLAELLGGDEYSLKAITDASSDAAVAMLLIIPTVFAAYVTRPGEHALRAFLLLSSRIRVLAAGVTTAICAVSIVAGFSHPWLLGVWGLACAVNAYVLAYLVVTAVRSSASTAHVAATVTQTVERSILRF